MKYVALNPEYVLKNDFGRVLIMTKDPLRTLEPVIESTIHPIHAMILSFFTGKTSFSDAVNEASIFLQTDKDIISSFCTKILENTQNIGVKIDSENILIFPRKTLVSSNSPISRTIYDYKKFNYNSLRIKTDRHYTPSRLTFMVTTKCYTDCIYCYANRKQPSSHLLPFERVKAIIKEARDLGVVSFDVIGGEFFKYPKWKQMLTVLFQYGYNPYISTKVPITKEDMKFLKKIGVKDIQVSLDTLIPKNIVSLIRVKETYVAKIKETINCLEEYGIEVQIHTILTSLNNSTEDMNSLLEFFSKKENIISWKIDYAASPIYEKRTNYEKVKIDRDSLKTISLYFEGLKKHNLKFRIVSGNLDLNENPTPNDMTSESKKLYFTKKRPIFCSANFSSLFILPDGKVTICEELYWNETFIIGDLNNQTLLDVWNSSRAKDLYYIDKKRISCKSPCYSCSIFKECREEYGGVCWKEIIKVFGKDKWDYPDPRCPKAGIVNAKDYV